MVLTRTVRRVGGSLMIAIPPEMAGGLGLGEGAAVTLRFHAGVIEIEPADLGERLRAEARQEAARLRDDSAYAAEMQSVREDMESVRAW
jgi:antitoxin component of MazEF toxin-antitoxin module